MVEPAQDPGRGLGLVGFAREQRVGQELGDDRIVGGGLGQHVEGEGAGLAAGALRDLHQRRPRLGRAGVAEHADGLLLVLAVALLGEVDRQAHRLGVAGLDQAGQHGAAIGGAAGAGDLEERRGHVGAAQLLQHLDHHRARSAFRQRHLDEDVAGVVAAEVDQHLGHLAGQVAIAVLQDLAERRGGVGAADLADGGDGVPARELWPGGGGADEDRQDRRIAAAAEGRQRRAHGAGIGVPHHLLEHLQGLVVVGLEVLHRQGADAAVAGAGELDQHGLGVAPRDLAEGVHRRRRRLVVAAAGQLGQDGDDLVAAALADLAEGIDRRGPQRVAAILGHLDQALAGALVAAGGQPGDRGAADAGPGVALEIEEEIDGAGAADAADGADHRFGDAGARIVDQAGERGDGVIGPHDAELVGDDRDLLRGAGRQQLIDEGGLRQADRGGVDPERPAQGADVAFFGGLGGDPGPAGGRRLPERGVAGDGGRDGKKGGGEAVAAGSGHGGSRKGHRPVGCLYERTVPPGGSFRPGVKRV